MTISGSEISFAWPIPFSDDNSASSSTSNTPERISAGEACSTSKNPQDIGSVKYHFYGVPPRNRTFVTRSNILADMEAALGEGSNSERCRILALRGLGGMGKTQLMLQYCYLHHTEYDFVFWLEVDSWSLAIDSFNKLANNLGFEKTTKERNSEDNSIAFVCSWLQKKTKWLLLLNNINNDLVAKDIFELLPRIGGDIILTTRVYIPPNKTIVIHVNKMKEAEAIFLLLSISSMNLIDQESSEFRNAQEIIAELDYMPLAIDLARAYVDNTQTSLQHYLNMFKTKRDVLFHYQDKDSSDEYNHTIATVWQLSIECIRIQNPAAVQILKACAFLQSENIPVSFFENQYLVLELLLALPENVENKEDSCKIIREAIAVLVNYSFVTRIRKEVKEDEEDPKSDLLTIHSLVQKVICDSMDSKEIQCWTFNIVVALNGETFFYDTYASHTRNIMNAYLSHIRHFITLLDGLSQESLLSKDIYILLSRSTSYLMDLLMDLDYEDLLQLCVRVSEAAYGPEHFFTARILDDLGDFYNRQSAHSKAEPLLKRALAIREKVLGLEHPVITSTLHTLANLYERMGRDGDAELLYQRVRDIAKKDLISKYSDMEKAMNNLALLHDSQSKSDEADSLLKQALMVTEKIPGTSHPGIVTALNSLAILYKHEGKKDDAERINEYALEIQESMLRSEGSDTTLSLISLTGFYIKQGMYNEAMLMLKQTLEENEKTHGSDHPVTASFIRILASCYERQAKFDEAELLYRRALTIYENKLGPEHPDTVMSLKCLANNYYCRDKYDEETEALLERVLAAQEKSPGPEHQDTVELLYRLAVVYEAQEKYPNAESLYERILTSSVKISGSEHPRTATALHNLAAVYQKQDKYVEAEPLYIRALAIWQEAFGAESLDIILTLTNLGALYMNQTKNYEAESFYKRSVTIIEKELGSEHQQIIPPLWYLAELYHRRGNFDESESLFQRALAISEKVLGSEDSGTMKALSNMAWFYERRGKYDEAEPLYKQALAICEKTLGSEHLETAQKLNDLATIYREQKKYNEAEPLFRRALAIRKKLLGSEHLDTAHSLRFVAELCFAQKEYNEAVLLYKQVLEIYTKAWGAKHPRTIMVENSLGLLKMVDICKVCHKKATYHCSKCKMAWYCTKEHQKVDWINHKYECQ